jgi:hypothetical protein
LYYHPRTVPWKKLLARTTGQIAQALRQKLEFGLEEKRVYRGQFDRRSPGWHLPEGKDKGARRKRQTPIPAGQSGAKELNPLDTARHLHNLTIRPPRITVRPVTLDNPPYRQS